MNRVSIDALKRSSMLLAGLYAFSSVANLVKEVVVAREFGATAAMDAFEIAWGIPYLLGNFLLGGVGGALVPHVVAWIDAQGRAQRNLWVFWRRVLWRLGAAVWGLAALGILFAPQVVQVLGYGLDDAGHVLSARLLRVLLVGTALMLPLGLSVVVAHAFGRFTWAGLPAGLGALTIALTVALLGARWGVRSLAWGTIVGQALSLTMMLTVLGLLHRTRTSEDAGPPVDPKVVRSSLAAVALVLLGWGGGILNVLVDKLMASGLEPGRVAALGYAYKMMMIPIGLFSSVVGVALLPALSHAAKAGDEGAERRALSYSVRALALILIPATAAFLAAPDLLVRGLYERKTFDATATDLTSVALAAYAPAILFRSFLTIFVTLLYARHRTRLAAAASLATVLVNPALNAILMKPYAHAGIAWSTSLVTFGHAAVLVWLVPSLRVLMRSRPILASLGRALGAAAVMAVAIRIGGQALAHTGASAVLVTAMVVVGGALVYAMSLALLGGRELREVAGALRR
jgi:putative peptidoglycan lipid II flippase